MEDGASSVSPFVLSLSVLGLLNSVVTSVSPAGGILGALCVPSWSEAVAITGQSPGW